MHTEVFQGILIPFLGTTLGSACVLFMKNRLNQMVQRVLTGFAAGVMVAASIWSLLIPAMEQSEPMGKLSFLPAAAGLVLVYKCGQEKLNNLYYQMKEQRRCSTWRKIKNLTLRNLNSRSWICIMPEEPRIHNWNVNMA